MSPERSPALVRSAPPTVPGMPTSVSRPARPCRAEAEISADTAAPAPARTRLPSTTTSANTGSLNRSTTPSTPFVADDQVAAAAEHAKRDVLLVTALDDGGQFLVRTRLDEHFGRAAQLQIGVGRQRLVALEDRFKLGETGHGVLRIGGERPSS